MKTTLLPLPSIDRLTQAFRAAVKAGCAAAEGTPEDGGTCNFDTPAVKVPRARLALLKAAAEAAGATLSPFSSWGPGWCWLHFDALHSGQASRRTRAAEAATHALNRELAGTRARATTYYQMD